MCVGASYVSLGCVGCIHGIGNDVTVAICSILLHGFDHQCSEMIGKDMQEKGVMLKTGIIPKKFEKVVGDHIKVTLSDGSKEVYDTVLVPLEGMQILHSLVLNQKLRNSIIPTIYKQTHVQMGMLLEIWGGEDWVELHFVSLLSLYSHSHL